MGAKGLKVIVGKTKVMIAGEGRVVVEEPSKWPCAVCKKRSQKKLDPMYSLSEMGTKEM